ncbi:MAG: hypothetical protein RR636_14570 [Clostridium sp.]|uniref:radical SAM protein n=1 Tax=Clostridium sp. TaxID=1506 RepID=UPI00304F4BE5
MRSYLKNLRDLSSKENKKDLNMLSNVIFTETRIGYSNNQYVDRLVLFLRGTGCSLVKETGGCTFCGFYNATNLGVKISDEEYIKQVRKIVNDKGFDISRYPIICIYNDGSMLREEEISFNALIKIVQMLNGKNDIKKIVIESRVEDITEEKLIKLKAATNKAIEIAVGFESANPLIRDLCINKNFENNVFEVNCLLAKKLDINISKLKSQSPFAITPGRLCEN